MNDNVAHTVATENVATGPHPRMARAVSLLHMAVIAFFTLGWLLPWSFVHWLVIGGGILMQFSWTLFDNDCPLTLLERRLAGIRAREGNPTEQRNFVSGLLSRVIGRTVSDRAGDATTYAVLFSSMLFCAVRLAL